MEGALRGATRPYRSALWPVCPPASPAIRRLYPDHDRLPTPVADAGHAGDVSNPRYDVRAAGAARGARGAGGVRRCLRNLRRGHASFHPATVVANRSAPPALTAWSTDVT